MSIQRILAVDDCWHDVCMLVDMHLLVCVLVDSEGSQSQVSQLEVSDRLDLTALWCERASVRMIMFNQDCLVGHICL